MFFAIGVSGGVSVRSLEWSTSEFGDFLEELGDLSWSPPPGNGHVWLFGPVGVLDSPKKLQGSGAATPKEELLGDRVLTWHPRGEATIRISSKARPIQETDPFSRHVLVDLLRGDNSLEKPLESSCLGQLNKIFNPCGTVPHSKWDVLMRMEDFTSSLSMY